jgi:hypothetical protein
MVTLFGINGLVKPKVGKVVVCIDEHPLFRNQKKPIPINYLFMNKPLKQGFVILAP